MRKLQLRDTFEFGRILKKVHIKDVIKNANSELKKESLNEDDKKEIFLNVLMDVMSAACENGVEKDIYEFLGTVTGKGADNIASAGLDEVISDVKLLAEENNLQVFFNAALKSMK